MSPDILMPLTISALACACIAAGLLVFLRRKRSGPAESSSLLAKTHQPLLVTNGDGVVQWANEAFEKLTGYTIGECKGKSGALLLGAAQNPKALQQFRTGLSTRKPFILDVCCSGKTGQSFWLQAACSPVLDKKGNPENFVICASDVTARKRVEDSLTLNARKQELLLRSAGEGIIGLDEKGTINYVNPSAARLTLWRCEELIGKPFTVIVHQLKVQILPAREDDFFLANALLEGSVLMGETDTFRRSDGTTFPVEYSSATIRDGNEILGAVVVFRDATDRRHLEQVRVRQGRQFAFRADIGFALANSDSLGKVLQRCTQALVRHLDASLCRVWTFNAAENVLELQVSAGLYTQTQGMDSRIQIGADKIGRIAKERVPELTNDLVNDPNIDQDWVKREKLVSFVGFPLLVENRLVGVVALYGKNPLPEDSLELLGSISDSIAQGILRKRAEEKVVEQAALLEKAQDAIIVIDLDSCCTYWNKSAERLYGWQAREVLGKRLDGLIYKEQAYFDQPRRAVLQQGEWRGEASQVTKGDDNVVVDSQWTLVHDDAGKPKSILIVNTDVTEKKKIEAQFLRTQRMESIGTLAGGIAHDLNNVLAPVLMSVEILKEKFKDDQSRRMLSIVESSAKRGADMVKQILTFSRGVEGERVILQPKHLIKEISKIVNETFPKSVQLKLSVAENLWTILGDATQLHQVLVNLAVNARDAMPSGGFVTITAENTLVQQKIESNAGEIKPGPYVLLKVSDTGTGIPREILDKIWEPFFTTKEVGKGTGLGLATVLGIIKSHGGLVQVQTELNRGTTFLIYLPASENVAVPTGVQEGKPLPLGKGEVILAVDDEASVLSMTKETLETYGYRVLTAKDGAEAVATFTANRAEIKGVLTDMVMPMMDGPSTIRVLKKLDPTVRIIAASGLMDSEKVKSVTEMDNICFLMKPYSAEKLLTSVHKLLNN